MNKLKKGKIVFRFLILKMFLCVVFGPLVFAQSEATDFSAASSWGRDPFTSAELDMVTVDSMMGADVENEIRQRRFNLTGILKRGNRAVAIVDQELVREGDLIDDAEVLKIETEKVVLKQDDKELELRL
jgi:hypothetical protein